MGARTVRRGTIDERAFHAWLTRHLPAGRRGLLPLGDDAAGLAPPRGRVAVVSTDSLVEGTHFLRGSPPDLIGAAAANVSLSDLAAKGADPAGMLLAVIVPPTTPSRWVQELARGAEGAAARVGAHVVGGDTKPGAVRTVVSTVIGWGTPGRMPPRGGARPGDILVTTGTVGRGGLAAEMLRRGGPRVEVLERFLDVRPRVAAGKVLGPLAHAMIDTSDGIADACRLVAAASRVRLVLQKSALPLDPGLRCLPLDRRLSVAFYGGDYELFAAVPRGRLAAALRGVRETGTRLSVVGRAERGHGAFLDTETGRVRVPEAGWQPFRVARSRSP